MKHQLIKAILKICAQALVIAALIGFVIGVIGYLNQWNSPISYSNAFFVAGCLMIIAGASSRFAAGQEWKTFQLLSTQSLDDMGSSERANFIVNASSPVRTVILGLLSGLILILISAIAAYLF